ncbi:nose resistant to fluoxetine protein 6-like [Pieris brassicae]|nr:nose resistant to fluoxetine protein 6-like [Pieris brassicae]
MLYYFLFFVSVGGVIGSNMELNATLLEWFPPLYGLDNWALCQKPTDKYCIVDAALYSSKPSSLLDVLKEYSSQTLKHFNRTQIHRGLCITRCGVNTTDVLEAAQACINNEVQKYELQAEVLSPQRCSTPGSKRASGSARALGVVMASIIILTIAATVVEFYKFKIGNKYLTAFSLINNWKILTGDRSKANNEERMKDLNSLVGIRVLAVEGVIFAHVLLCFVYTYTDNPEYVERMYDNIGWKLVFNSPLWLQAFFAMTGFITAYSLLIYTEKRELSIWTCILAIAHRWMRLTPTSMFVIWFSIAWYPLMGSGPHWTWVVDRESQDCLERWSYHLIHIQNYLPLGKFCSAQTWYIATDFQLHVFGIMLMFVLLRFRRLVFPVLTTILVVSAAWTAFDVYYYNLLPIIAAQSPEVLRTIYKDSKLHQLIYLPMWMNLAGYACGIAVGFIHYNNQQNGVKLNEKKWFSILSQVSLNLVNVVIFVGIPFLGDKTPPLWASVIYAAFDRTIFSLLFSTFLLGIISKCKSPFLTICSWRGYRFLARLTYCAYILHFTILRLAIAYNTQLGHTSIFGMISLLILGTVLTYIVSIPVSLLIELPIMQLWKALLSNIVSSSIQETPNQRNLSGVKSQNED